MGVRERQEICRAVKTTLHLSAEHFFLDLVVAPQGLTKTCGGFFPCRFHLLFEDFEKTN